MFTRMPFAGIRATVRVIPDWRAFVDAG